MNDLDLKLFSSIARLSEDSLLKTMRQFLKKYYKNNVMATKEWILCEGNIPVMLVSHMDTVFKTPPKKIYHDTKENILWSPQGLGADDRAGIFAIIKILEAGFKPHILLTTKEERGGLGVLSFLRTFITSPFDLKYIIELDRRGEDDCVFYGCGNEEFEIFVEDYGFYTDWGVYSDISDICPRWGIAGVNLSVGYENEHTFVETLNTRHLYATIEKVKKMLNEIGTAPYFKFIQKEESLYDYYFSHVMYICSKCKGEFPEEDIFAVKTKTGGYKYICSDCFDSSIEFCGKCNMLFEKESEGDLYCCDCRK
jgi:hypothetical protein